MLQFKRMDKLINRQFWLEKITKAWEHCSIIWLSGVRRTGKTSLAQTLDAVKYFDCELPRIRRLMDGPEEFLATQKGKRIILDEIHWLSAPSELLKIAEKTIIRTSRCWPQGLPR